MRKLLFATAILLFVACIALTIHARVAYPQPIYEYIYPGDPRYTGEVVEWFDRASGWEVQQVLVYDPENPAWVDILQSGISFLILVGLFIFVALSGPKIRQSRFQD
jgi:hypothetical protein